MNRFLLLMASNDNPRQQLQRAEELLLQTFPQGTLFSDFLQTMAQAKDGSLKPDAPSYYNAVCLGHTDLTLKQVLLLVRQMEIKLGRIRGPESGGKVAIDLDLVQWNDEIIRPDEASKSYYKDCLALMNLQTNG